jgi:hypothetical protein
MIAPTGDRRKGAHIRNIEIGVSAPGPRMNCHGPAFNGPSGAAVHFDIMG